MKKNHWPIRLAGLLLLSYTLLVVSVMAAGTVGSESDPLVTLSYLNDTFKADLLKALDEKIAARDKELSDKLSAQVKADTEKLAQTTGVSVGAGSAGSGDTFSVVTLSKGQTLTGEIGCEVMLRVGTATCVAGSSPGLIDETTAGTLNSGKALTQNHLYMMTIADRGVKASADTVKLLVRGGYTVS